MGFRRFQVGFLVLVGLVSSTVMFYGCSNSNSSGSTPVSQYVYVASGNTYAGNLVVAATPSNVVSKFNLDGTLNSILADYTLNPGDTPVSVLNYDEQSLLVLVENVANIGNRRVDRVFKNGSGAETFLLSTAGFGVAANILNDMAIMSDGGLLVSRGQVAPNGQLEKFTAAKGYIQFGAINYVNNPQGNPVVCNASTARFTHIVTGPNGVIVAAHALVGQNRIDIINPQGYQVATDCFSAQSGPGATFFPSAMLYHTPTGLLFVAYSNTTGPIYQIYAYSFNGNSLTLVSANPVYNNLNVVQGPSAMAMMSDGSILIANGISTFNTVEKFTWDPVNLVLDRVGSTSLIPPSVYTRSISSLVSPAE
jgi:hypothetical protein